MRDEAPRILLAGEREHMNVKDDGKSNYNAPPTTNEKGAFQWLVDSFVDYPFSPKTDCPHQSNDR